MHKPDYDKFRAMLDQFAVLFSKDKPDDILVHAYWSALKDLPWEIVEACGASHRRYGKFFPKPVELRPRDEKPKQNLPSGEAPRNHVRDYWRSLVVFETADAMGYRFGYNGGHARFEHLIGECSTLREGISSLLNDLDAQERRDGRTHGMSIGCSRRCMELAIDHERICADNSHQRILRAELAAAYAR